MTRRGLLLRRLRLAFGGGPALVSLVILTLVLLMAVFAPLLATADPTAIAPADRLSGLTIEHPLGTDAYGRDVYSRVLHGARVSLLVGAGAALVSVAVGLVIGVFAGYFRALDSVIMRTMDGIMAIPSILLAIALISLTGASLLTVLVAITIPEIPRVVRLVRSVILNVRSEAYVEAAITLGSPVRRILLRHMVPNTVAPLIVQGTFVFASAILTEATLSFLGAGLPTEIPSWGNIMSEGRSYFQLFPGLVLWPGLALALTLLSVNVLGDVLRDTLDPKMEKRT
ncbi:putative peptide ABC transporter permease protein [Pseudooceanicola batsensis HTCC2597]|uniref:Putative peptide ABC transporter permease protein n=1 Tax=Pseudooceanicola batsensis (strain ATCC BAA-863 / DSM 15984 / KCTC 12145 / HTCC2597) TaxID=252305 RepID=A3U1A2_PSEBH|nr:ABC transporter permease [Pseudooceanicola batsensis]EAQ02085.1 putative peptide ABC transporter permease protein [Pseudooceanicola batsensis HTCC2597]